MEKLPKFDSVSGTDSRNRFNAKMRAPSGLNLLVKLVIDCGILGKFLLRNFYAKAQLAGSLGNIEIFNSHRFYNLKSVSEKISPTIVDI